MSDTLVWHRELPANTSAILSAPAQQLVRAQSLTAALRRLEGAFSVRLLHLGSCGFDNLFSDGLDNGAGQAWFARDVLLCLDGTPVVWARSMCGASARNWLGLLDCGTRPLGERLFDGSLPLSRSPFGYALLNGYRPAGQDALLARRSFFDWHGERLGLAECFLRGLQNFV